MRQEQKLQFTRTTKFDYNYKLAWYKKFKSVTKSIGKCQKT